MRVLFVDRDGTIIHEPADYRVDRLEKLVFLPYVIQSLGRIQAAGYELVMVSNQDGLGGTDFTREQFEVPHRKMLEILAGEGILFREVFVDAHYEHEQHPNRKPGIGMVLPFVQAAGVQLAQSYMVGDRKTDAQFAANLGVQSLTIKDPASQDGDLKLAHVASAPTLTFTNWPQLTEHVLREGLVKHG